MPKCDFCGASYRGGHIKLGRYRFCNGVCAERGRNLCLLDEISEDTIMKFIDEDRHKLCPICRCRTPIDVYRSYSIYSLIFYTKWQTNLQISCDDCGKDAQREKLWFCAIAGWWGVPFGLLTPIFIIKNLFEIFKSRNGPSEDFARIVKIKLSNLMEAQNK